MTDPVPTLVTPGRFERHYDEPTNAPSGRCWLRGRAGHGGGEASLLVIESWLMSCISYAEK